MLNILDQNRNFLSREEFDRISFFFRIYLKSAKESFFFLCLCISYSMNFITEWLRQCSNCFNEKSPTITSNYNLNIENFSKECSHEKDILCEKCFKNYFLYDRFIINQLYIYLKEENNFITRKNFSIFTQRILHWNEFTNHLDFILQLLHIIFLKNVQTNSIYQLIEDAFFFTTIQSNIEFNNKQIDFLQKFFLYFNQLNLNNNCQIYFNLIKRLLPWCFISIHKWLKLCLLSTINLTKTMLENIHFDLDLSFLWYLTNWLVYNKVFLNEYDPIKIFEKISHHEYLTNLYDSDKHGYSIVTLCQLTYHIDGPFLLIFSCQDQKIFAILLDGKLLDSTKSCK